MSRVQDEFCHRLRFAKMKIFTPKIVQRSQGLWSGTGCLPTKGPCSLFRLKPSLGTWSAEVLPHHPVPLFGVQRSWERTVSSPRLQAGSLSALLTGLQDTGLTSPPDGTPQGLRALVASLPALWHRGARGSPEVPCQDTPTCRAISTLTSGTTCTLATPPGRIGS